ncbi:MAG TPA: hypothetical protein ENJ24_00150 [Gammaproteobacteria bacterium]|nr:hypothetical protein [Gammaproteobacteria bacterium]
MMFVDAKADQTGSAQRKLISVDGLRTVSLLGLLLLTSLSAGARESRIEVGVEQFDWREYDESGKRLLSETGPRVLIGFERLSGSAGGNSFFSLAVRGYFGNVDYQGHLQHPNGLLTPYSTNTHYWGVAIDPRYTVQFLSSRLNFIPSLSLGVGSELWLRDLRGIYGYKEYYAVGYARFEVGLKSRQPSGWFGRLGIKTPFLTREKVTGFYLDGACGDVELVPGGNSTVSFTIGYRLPNRSAVSLGYDGYQFSPSPRKEVRCDNQFSGVDIFQPRSEMMLLSVRYSVPL